MTRPMSLVHLATLGAAAGMALLVACAASTTVKERQASPIPDREEILDLESEMRQWRVELGLAPSPAGAFNGAVAEVCEGLTQCKDACKLADAICQNKDRICDIARRLADDWATGKCESAKRSCSEARQVCDCCEKRERNGLLPSQPCAPPQP